MPKPTNVLSTGYTVIMLENILFKRISPSKVEERRFLNTSDGRKFRLCVFMDIITWNMIDELLREVKKISKDMEAVKANIESIQRKLESIEVARK